MKMVIMKDIVRNTEEKQFKRFSSYTKTQKTMEWWGASDGVSNASNTGWGVIFWGVEPSKTNRKFISDPIDVKDGVRKLTRINNTMKRTRIIWDICPPFFASSHSHCVTPQLEDWIWFRETCWISMDPVPIQNFTRSFLSLHVDEFSPDIVSSSVTPLVNFQGVNSTRAT